MQWSEFESMCPELAGIGQRRLQERHLCLIGTLRLGAREPAGTTN